MKNTWIVTMEVTLIDDRELDPSVERIKELLDADDVVITKVQQFEGADESVCFGYSLAMARNAYERFWRRGRKMMLISDGTITPIVNRLADAMGVILAYVDKATHGIFFTRNVVGDPMHNIYKEDGIAIDICEKYEYFEVFGLTEDEQRDLEKFYCALVSSWKKFRQYA